MFLSFDSALRQALDKDLIAEHKQQHDWQRDDRAGSHDRAPVDNEFAFEHIDRNWKRPDRGGVCKVQGKNELFPCRKECINTDGYYYVMTYWAGENQYGYVAAQYVRIISGS